MDYDALDYEQAKAMIKLAAPEDWLKQLQGLWGSAQDAIAKLPEQYKALPDSYRRVGTGAALGAGLGGLSSLWQPRGHRNPLGRMLTGGMLGGIGGLGYHAWNDKTVSNRGQQRQVEQELAAAQGQQSQVEEGQQGDWLQQLRQRAHDFIAAPTREVAVGDDNMPASKHEVPTDRELALKTLPGGNIIDPRTTGSAILPHALGAGAGAAYLARPSNPVAVGDAILGNNIPGYNVTPQVQAELQRSLANQLGGRRTQYRRALRQPESTGVPSAARAARRNTRFSRGRLGKAALIAGLADILANVGLDLYTGRPNLAAQEANTAAQWRALRARQQMQAAQ